MRYATLSFLLLFPFMAIATAHGCPSGTKVEGRYVAHKPKGYLPSTLVVSPLQNEDSLSFELESYWAQKPYDDGCSTTQGIFSGELQVRWCVGHYVAPEGNCFLVFNFAKNQVKVTSFGTCQYGHNAYPDATYLKLFAQ